MSITEMDKMIHDLTVENGELKTQLANAGGGEAIAQLRADLATANDKVSELENEKPTWIAERDRFELRAGELSTEVIEKDKQLDAANAQIIVLQDTIKSLSQSPVAKPAT